MQKNTHSKWMDRAAQLAWKGVHTVQSNPMVGAILVSHEGKKIGEGYHRRFGGPHAEVEAIRDAIQKGYSPNGAHLYVTLEPCCHTGKQGPCTDAIRAAGISQVFYAQTDPNPLMKGKGVQWLTKNRIKIEKISSQATERLNEIYLINVREKRPFVHLKVACTQNFKITLKKGSRCSLSGKKSQERTHQLRNRADGILIGVQTLLIDNPQLTTRLPKGPIHSPIRIILDSHLRTPATAQIFKEKGENWILTLQTSIQKPAFQKSFQIVICKKNKAGQIDLKDAIKKLFQKGIRNLLVEGGMQVSTSLVNEKLVDRISLIVTPHWSKDQNAPALLDAVSTLPLELEKAKIEKLEEDIWIEGRLLNKQF